MSKYSKFFILLFLIILAGCSSISPKASKTVFNNYKKMGWKHYYDRNGAYSLFYPPEWKLIRGGKDYIQIYSYDPKKTIASQHFFGKMVKTEIYWQNLNGEEMNHFPEIEKNENGYQLKKNRFNLELNGVIADRWTGQDILQRNRNVLIFDPNAIQPTDITTEIVTNNRLYMIVTFTSGDKDKVPLQKIIEMHNSFSL